VTAASASPIGWRDGDSGRTVERWSSADFLGLLVQIGAMPAPA
jgi:hypothetical protein